MTDRPTKSHEYLFLLTKSPSYYYDANAIREPLAATSIARLSQQGLSQQEGSHRVPGKDAMKAVPPRRSGNKARKYGDERDRPESHLGASVPWEDDGTGRNRRSVWSIDEDEYAQFLDWKAGQPVEKPDVWTVNTRPFKGAHFATFPAALVEPCILAGSQRGDTVLDPFGGAGTTALVADRLGRNAILCELNPEYASMARERIDGEAPLFAEVQQ